MVFEGALRLLGCGSKDAERQLRAAVRRRLGHTAVPDAWSDIDRTVLEEHAQWLACGELGVVYEQGIRGQAAALEPREMARCAAIAREAEGITTWVLQPVRALLDARDDERFKCPFRGVVEKTRNRWGVRSVFREGLRRGRGGDESGGRGLER